MLPVETPFKIYTGLDGLPLQNGYVYFGLPNQNPLTAPVTVYWDAAGTQPAAQPLRTVNGYIVRAGTPANVFCSVSYSELVKDSAGGQVFYARTSDDFSITSAVLNFITSLATSIGSSLIGFIQAGVGAVLRTLQAKARETVSPEDFGAVGDGIADDSAALMRAINSFASATGCAVRLTPGKIYLILSTLTTNNRNLVIDGNNAILLIGANMTYGLSVISTNCEIRNLQVNKSPGVVVTAAVFMTGLQHVMRNVTSRAQVFPIFIHAQELSESHFSEMRVDADPTNKTGIIFQFDYCVNNTISDSMLGFCDQGIYCSSIPRAVYNNHTEGLLISNVIIVFAKRAVNLDFGTFIAISNSVFDFCEVFGVFISNGNTLSITNCWIASNVTNGFIGVGALAVVSNVSVIGTSFVRGASPIINTSGVSLAGINSLVIANRFQSGMNGGIVTDPTSQVFGNTISGGGTNISAVGTISSVVGSLAVSADVTIAGNLIVSGSKGIFPTGLSGTATTGANGAPPAQVAGYFSVFVSGTAYKIPYYNV